MAMAVHDVSTFPPLLEPRSSSFDASGASERKHPREPAASAVQKPKAAEMSKRQGPPSPRCCPASRAQFHPQGGKFGFEQDAEQKKKTQRAEESLKRWEALLLSDRNVKLSNLKRRVQLQRELITKTAQVSEELRAKAKEKEAIQSKQTARKKMVRELLDYSKRVQEHKQCVATKMSQLEQEVQERDTSGSVARRSTQSEMSSFSAESKSAMTPEVTRAMVDTAVNGITVQPASVHTIWNLTRAHAARKLRPIEDHAQSLKQHVSPTVKMCLQVFEQPTVHDQYTGKPIPLTEVLSRSTCSTSGKAAPKATLLECSVKHTQRKAEIMLQRRWQQSIQHCVQHNPSWYLKGDQFQPSLTRESRKCSTFSQSPSMYLPHPQHHPVDSISPKVRKMLPRFLTVSDSLAAASLLEFDDKVHFYPSTSKRALERSCSTNTNPGTRNASYHVGRGKGPLFTQQQPSSESWQPLSQTALCEHSGVNEVVAAGPGHLAHGQYKLWRPSVIA